MYEQGLRSDPSNMELKTLYKALKRLTKTLKRHEDAFATKDYKSALENAQEVVSSVWGWRFMGWGDPDCGTQLIDMRHFFG